MKTRFLIILFLIGVLVLCLSAILPPCIDTYTNDVFENKIIPKVIHQTYKSAHELPDLFKQSQHSWKTSMPTYQYAFWSDHVCKRFIEESFPEFRVLYNQLRLIEKTDLFRYLCIYQYGGVYADMDTICLKNMDPLLSTHPMLIGIEYDKGSRILDRSPQYNQWCFASYPHNPFFYELAKQIQYRHDLVKRIGKHLCLIGDGRLNFMSDNELVYWKTGPYIFSDMINHENVIPSKYIRKEKKGVLGHFGTDLPNHQTYVRHEFESSWKRKKISKKYKNDPIP